MERLKYRDQKFGHGHGLALALGHGHEHEPIPRWFIIAQVVLRILTIVCTIVSIVVMTTSGTSDLMIARYTSSSAFKALVGVDAAVCVLVLVSLVALCVVYKKQHNRMHMYLLFLHDLIVMTLMIAACGAATAVGDVAVHGQPKTFWFKICNAGERFCTSVEASIAMSYIAFLCLFALTILSPYMLLKHPPTPPQELEFVYA